jgi:3-phosphoshikimate 1-carboxyvinyltransferase
LTSHKALFLRLSGSRPTNFRGSVKLPPSKSYLHRALFVSSLCKTQSTIEGVDSNFSEDIKATVNALRSFGIRIQKIKTKPNANSLLVGPPRMIKSSGREIFAGGSGTTARFAIAFSAIPRDEGKSIISGDASLLNRPMRPLIDALSQIGVRCYSKNSDGRLPVVVEANGIAGGKCRVDGSISSQFISALLIACTQAQNDTTIEIDNPSKMVSYPYVEATKFVLEFFGFDVRREKSKTASLRFHVQGNQTNVRGRRFSVPSDMSSGAAIIGATLSTGGKVRLDRLNLEMPQADSVFLNVARMFGASVIQERKSLIVSAQKIKEDNNQRNSSSPRLILDLKDSPDIAPIVAGVAAGLNRGVKIRNIEHLRFKESDRLTTLSSELTKIGVQITENRDSLSISPSAMNNKQRSNEKRSPTILNSENDHRILMALAIAGLSGRFGELLIIDPSCVKKSYPSFIADLKFLANKGGNSVVSIIKKEENKG